MTDEAYIEEIECQAALYALGALPPQEADTFRKRLSSNCPLCVAKTQECAETIHLLPLSVPQVPPPDSLRGRLMEAIEKTPATEAADQMLLVRPGDTPWNVSPFPGVEMRFLFQRKTMLVRMASSSKIPAHPHATSEQCLVLEGSVTSNGVTASAGDFVYMPAGSAHDDLYSPNGALLLISYA